MCILGFNSTQWVPTNSLEKNTYRTTPIFTTNIFALFVNALEMSVKPFKN
uniref:Uncharacterized protein n=1 Tax=Anguilla anguilla TaxID=7936 RepID=A0A0E9T1M3_ANGAN